MKVGRRDDVRSTPKTRTLLFAISLPETFDPEEVDPEMVADEMVEMINEERRRNGGFGGDVEVSGIPPAVWMTSRTLTDLRAAVEQVRAGQERAE